MWGKPKVEIGVITDQKGTHMIPLNGYAKDLLRGKERHVNEKQLSAMASTKRWNIKLFVIAPDIAPELHPFLETKWLPPLKEVTE